MWYIVVSHMKYVAVIELHNFDISSSTEKNFQNGK